MRMRIPSTNQEYRVFLDIDSSNDLTYRIPQGNYFSYVVVSLFQMYTVQQKGNKVGRLG